MKKDLSDVTIMIPVKIDSEDRINNLNIVAMYLRENFNVKIIVAEQDVNKKVPEVLCKTLYDTYIHYRTDLSLFHKTKLINLMVKKADTPIVAMHDSDVLFHPNQYIDAANQLRNNKFDFVYPFNGRCVNINKKQVPRVMESLKFDFVRVKITNHKALAMGGCVMYNKRIFVEGGMMNENFMSYGPEDGEQDLRLKKLGYRTNRIGKPLFHLDHVRTKNSQEHHENAKNNWEEFKKIKRMKRNDLRNYVSTWPWAKP